MVTQGGHRILPVVEHPGDGREAEAEVAQQQDALQPHEGVAVVVAVAAS